MLFDGPTGKLEGELTRVSGAKAAAVLCHPHPQMGGSMHDGVVGTLKGSFLEQGISTLCFNYRSVGASDGAYDKGTGEVDDVLAAADRVRVETGASRLILAGYSFGGVMALKAVQTARPDALLLIAPALSMAPDLAPPEIPGLVVLAARDQFVDIEQARNRFGDNAVIEIMDTDHFFSGQHESLGDRVSKGLAELARVSGLAWN